MKKILYNFFSEMFTRHEMQVQVKCQGSEGQVRVKSQQWCSLNNRKTIEIDHDY